MLIEVKLEQLITDAFPGIKEGDSSTGLDGVLVEVWSGTLANLVSAILRETSPAYTPYQDN